MLHSGNAQPPTTNSHLFPRPWLEFENFDGVYSFLLCVSWGTYVILRPPLLKQIYVPDTFHALWTEMLYAVKQKYRVREWNINK